MKTKLGVFKFLTSVSVLAILLVPLLPITLYNNSSDVVSAEDLNDDNICVPDLSDDPNRDDKDIKIWRRLKFSYINRATIRVTFEGESSVRDCTNMDIQDLYIVPQVKFSDLLTQNLYDDNTADDTFNYKYSADGAGDSRAEESVVDNFGSSNGTSDDFGGRDSRMTADQFNSFVNDSEYIPGIEEDAIENRSCPGGTNDNFMFYDTDNDDKSYEWHCSSAIPSNAKGLGVRARLDGDGGVEKFNITYVYKDGKVTHVSKNEQDTRTFTWCDSLNTPQWRTEDCDGPLYLDGVSQADIENIGSGTADFDMKKDNDDRFVTVRVAGDESESADTLNEASGESGGNADPANINCEIQLINPLTWIACPLIEAAQAAVEQFDNAITRKLTIDTDTYFNTTGFDAAGNIDNTGKSFYAGWSSVRTLALTLLVLAGLVMVISQMISISVFDAYTVKKIMPRIAVAVILTALSWELMKFAIDLSNAAGHGVRYIIFQPFAANFDEAKVGAGLASLLGFGAGAALVGLTMLGMMSFALTALMAVIIGFGLIVFREMLVMLLVIAAPFAIACYILPNTQKAWRLWWDFFTKALLVFPIIVGMIAIGRVFAIIATDGGDGDLMSQTVGFIAYYGPYFLLPAAFRMAGGAMATISGVANDKSRGAFDRLKKYRQGKLAQSGQRMGNYQRYSDKHALGRGANKALGAIANPRDAIRGRKGINAGYRAGRVNQGAENLKSDPTFAANQGNDAFLLSLANEKLANEKIDQARTKYSEAVRTHGAESSEALGAQRELQNRQAAMQAARRVTTRNSSATRMAAAQELAKTGYQFSPGQQGYEELSETMRDITGGDMGAYTDAMNTAQYHLKGAGRLDLAGINHGASLDTKGGFRKLGNYQRGQGKTDTYHGGAQAWLGSGTVGEDGKTLGTSGEIGTALASSLASGETSAKEVGDYHAMLIRDKESANDVNKIEIQKQIEAIEGVASVAGASGDARDAQLFNRIAVNKLEVSRQKIDPSELETK